MSDAPEKRDLAEEMRDAINLISAARELSSAVDENKVLNGGNNKTEVEVKSTLNGDIIDRALESAQRKADNFKKLLATLIPVFLLFTGGGMEAFGVIDIFENDEVLEDIDNCEYGIDTAHWVWEEELIIFGELWTDCSVDSSTPPEDLIIMINLFDPESKDYIDGNIQTSQWDRDSDYGIEFRNLDETEVEAWIDIFTPEMFDNGDPPLAQYMLPDIVKTVEIIEGCMDSNAINYNEEANTDDGSCEYEEEKIYGCTDPDANNYDVEATDDDGSCEYEEEIECDDPLQYNVTSVSAQFVINGSNSLDLKWTFVHDGPESWSTSCYDWVQLEINLYKDGTHHATMSWNELGWWGILGHEIEYVITAEDADILGDLPAGQYDALLKFWEDGDGGPDPDVFTNKVRIG